MAKQGGEEKHNMNVYKLSSSESVSTEAGLPIIRTLTGRRHTIRVLRSSMEVAVRSQQKCMIERLLLTVGGPV